MKKIYLLFFVLSMLFTEAFPAGSNPSTQGSEFYFSFPRARPGRTKLMILTISSSKPGKVKITDADGNFVIKPFNAGTTTIDLVKADGSDIITNYYLPGLTSCYQITSNTKDKKGYIVETFEVDETTPLNVSIYAGLSGTDTTDAANIYPIEALGNEYYILSHIGYFQDGDILVSEALVVATQNDTEIEIIPTCLLDNQASTENLKPTTIILDKGETYQIRAFDHTIDLTGTVIRTKDDSNISGNKCKPIAVFSGNQHPEPGDYEYEQIFPTHLLGNEYLISAPEDGSDNIVRIVVTKPCTDITINGNFVGTFNQTDYTDFELKPTSGCYIQTNKPVGVAMYTADFINGPKVNGEDASMIVLAPIEQNLDSIIFTGVVNSDAPTTKVSIVAPTLNTSDVSFYELIAGTTWTPILLSGWTVISENATYSTVTSGISPTSTYKITSTKGGFNAYVYGYGEGAEYSYSVGSSARPAENSFFLNDDPSLNSNNTIKPCIGNAVKFEANTADSYTEIIWDFGDGARDTTYAPINYTSHPYATKGTYTVQMIVTKNYSECYGSVGTQDTATT
ncbi:MAG: PKD domain-containing protein, partial [Paludibacteraceae bacterium]|nr:PKD domain-containing protein [Paludibacteraceae bacterium]